MNNWFKEPLRSLLADKSTLPHALLLTGVRGIGKQQFGMALAQALLCETPAADGAACGACSGCNWFTSGSHPDFRSVEPVTEEDAENEDSSKKSKSSVWISIEQVRELHDFIHITSHRGGRKVILVAPAEALNVSAANALLKNLEEPPAMTHFILISHRPHRLPRTIVSRCRQLGLRAPSRDVALAWLKEHGVAEGGAVLAQCSGAPLLALAAAEGDELAGRREFLSHIAPAEFDALAVADTLRDLPLERFINWMQKWTYDLVEQRMLGRIRYNPDFARELAVLAQRIHPLAALRLHRKLVHEQRYIHHPLNGRLYIESVLIAYAALINSSTREKAA